MTENAVTVNGLSVSYGCVEAIEGITLDIKKGEFISIIGPNGGGKTTLLNTMLGFLKPDSGTVKILGKDIKKAYSEISFVPQFSSADRNFPISVIESIMTAGLKSGLHPFRFFSKSDRKKAEILLKTVGLEDFSYRSISALSGGEFQRLLIARALAQEPEILLLDEPTASVDALSRNMIFSLLAKLNKNGMTVICVTHDRNAAKEYSSKIAVINRRLTFYGKPEEIHDIDSLAYGENAVSGEESKNA